MCLERCVCAKVMTRDPGCAVVDSARMSGSRGAAALCWAGCPGCPDALHLQGQHFPAAPLATLLTGCLEQKVEPVFPLLPLTIMSVERRVVWCPQIHRGVSLEGTFCGRKRLRLRLLTARRRASSSSLAGGTFCHFLRVCHHPSHTQRRLHLTQGSYSHSKLHFLLLRAHALILVLSFPAPL